MSKSKQLHDFLSRCILGISVDGSGGAVSPTYPQFELYASDYLEFAEKRLNNIEKYKDDVDELINCVAHLKRAVDCQLDTFLYCCNLHKTVTKNNLKFENKLDFLKDIGAFNSRSLNRLNTLRNKMEHNYETPKISDIELYYDLVSAFISFMQGLIYSFTHHENIECLISDEYGAGIFTSTFKREEPVRIEVSWHINQTKEKEELSASIEELKDFTYFFKIHILIMQMPTFTKSKHVLEKIKLP